MEVEDQSFEQLLDVIRKKDFDKAINIASARTLNHGEKQKIIELCNQSNNKSVLLEKFIKFIK